MSIYGEGLDGNAPITHHVSRFTYKPWSLDRLASSCMLASCDHHVFHPVHGSSLAILLHPRTPFSDLSRPSSLRFACPPPPLLSLYDLRLACCSRIASCFFMKYLWDLRESHLTRCNISPVEGNLAPSRCRTSLPCYYYYHYLSIHQCCKLKYISVTFLINTIYPFLLVFLDTHSKSSRESSKSFLPGQKAYGHGTQRARGDVQGMSFHYESGWIASEHRLLTSPRV